MSIQVAIVEDDQNVRENLAWLINRAPGLSCPATFPTAEVALRELPKLSPEVVLMDIHLPRLSGIDCVRRLKSICPQTQIIMLTVEEDTQRVFESLKAGATGYLVKHVEPQEILAAINEVFRGGAPMSSHIARMVVAAFRNAPEMGGENPPLSSREQDVLRLLARGYRSKEIAEELAIGVGTVNTHVRHIYEKLHVRSRAEAVAKHLGSRD